MADPVFSYPPLPILVLAPPFPTPAIRLALALNDGRGVVARPVVPEDRDRIESGFDKLSDRSRQLRFFAPVATLSDAELRYLTELDYVHHAAWGLLDLHETPPGMGVGRFVRLPDKPDAAEFSLTVADDVQGSGVGRLLLALLLVHAQRVDVRMLCGLVERDNERVIHWMLRLGFDARATEDGMVFHLPTDASVWTLETESARHLAASMQAVREAWNEAITNDHHDQPQNDA